MAMEMRWVGEEELDRVAETRWMCYAHAGKELERYRQRLRADPRSGPGDYLLAERDGAAVGTATSLPMTMWVRGSPLSCQGVAWVGTIKTERRRGGEAGVASAVMREVLRMARHRRHVVSALMPFRVSFYEHFGYGVMERRAEWTIPLSTLPIGDCAGWRFINDQDRPALAAQWQRAVEAGQCDVERSERRWNHRLLEEEEGMTFVDRPGKADAVRASAFVAQESLNGRNILKVQEWSAESPENFRGLLSFLGTMRDQFSAASIVTPADWPVNRLLREAQIPHRPVDHPTAEVRPYTRMQLRILDHGKFLESLNLPQTAKGRASVGVLESEGEVSRFSVEMESGRARVSAASGEVDFECLDRHWSAIATGDLPATRAVQLGLAKARTAGACSLLDALSAGPAPFCREYF
jgi:predicted acetyltransferase